MVFSIFSICGFGVFCGRPRGGAPTISLPHYADLVYFAGAHVGAPLQPCYRIMRIWCILRATTWGRPYNLVTASCGFDVFCGRPRWSAPTTLLPHHADLLHCGRPHRGAPTTLLPHHADLVYFAGGHIGASLQPRYRIMWVCCISGAHMGAPLQSRYRIMRIWCILRAPTLGRPYNLVTALCGFGVFCGRPRRGAPTISLPHHVGLLHFAGGHMGAPLQPCYRIMRIWCILRAPT